MLGIPMDTHSDFLQRYVTTYRFLMNYVDEIAFVLTVAYSVIAFWLGTLPCTVFNLVECPHRWNAMLSFIVSVLAPIYAFFVNCHLSL